MEGVKGWPPPLLFTPSIGFPGCHTDEEMLHEYQEPSTGTVLLPSIFSNSRELPVKPAPYICLLIGKDVI